ncbi:fibronectin type III domain-containing protein [Natrinema altunense]|uniref:Fibronectin type III domain-containing protein n=1 Tax=Natrinema altunense TaxID=222984 RepID=A0A482Y0Y0_9EURY|nr:fibronectin type III domain-containing protein [Natrinema altunense]RZH66397.1 fibronectin type III domain-containing protein [Natrinema altunense]
MRTAIDSADVRTGSWTCLVAVLVLTAAVVPVMGTATAAVVTDSATEGAPSVDTTWADVLNDSAVIVAGNLTALGDATNATVRFEYRQNDSSDAWSTTAAESTGSTGAFRADLAGLEPGTVYAYRAVAETAVGVDRGEARTIETPADRPEATTTGATAVGETEATLGTNVTDLGGEPSAEVWFSYSPTADSEPLSEWTETPTRTVNATGPATRQVTGLEPGTEYEFTSHVRTDREHGLSTGYERFTTASRFAVETGTATDVTETNATLTGEIVAVGDAATATARFEYRRLGTADWTTTEAVDSDSAGRVRTTVDGLEPGTNYEFRIVGEAADGDSAVGAIETVETAADPVVETGGVVSVGEESATVAGELVALGGADAATVAIQYRDAGASTWHETGGETLSTSGTFDASLTGLASGTDYEYRTVVRADGVTETGATATLTTDAATHEPTVDALSGSDDSSPNPHADLAVDWQVSDADGDLSSVAVTIRDGNGRVVASETASVAGESADGSLTETVKHGAGTEYDVALTVTDETGATATDRTTIAA